MTLSTFTRVFSKPPLGCLLFCILGSLLLPLTMGLATSFYEAFSTLSPGNFNRQLPLPPTTPLSLSHPLRSQAQALYQTLPYGVGERLRFQITYLGLKGGTAEILVREPIEWENTFAHRFTGEAKSAEWFSWVTQLHDGIESLALGTPEVIPLQFYINQLENSFKQSKIVEFDWKNRSIHQRFKRPSKELKLEHFELHPGVKDAASALYFLRLLLQKNEISSKIIEFPIFTSEKTWTARAHLISEEPKSVGGVTIPCDVLELTTHFGGLMEQKGKMRFWMSKDARRIPLYIEADIRFGHIKVKLLEWDPPDFPHPNQSYSRLLEAP